MSRTGLVMSAGGPRERLVEAAVAAEEAGFDYLGTPHIAGRDSFTTLQWLAGHTERIPLGTAVAPLYHRSPASMAQTAATVDDLTGGRFRLGLGSGHQVTMGGWHGNPIGKPVTEMREYVGIVRALLRGEEVPQGERFTSTFGFMGFTPRPELPIYMAALSPRMLRLAGELADGVVLWVCTSDYVRDVVVPEVAAGRAIAGKTMEGFEVMPAVIASATADREAAHGAVRDELLRYFALPFYRAAIDRAGWTADLEAFDAAESPDAKKAAISDAFLESLCAIGSQDEVRAGVERFRAAGATLPALSPTHDADVVATVQALAAVSA